MSLRLEMLQVARLAPRLLGESSELVRRFLLQQQNQDGGFNNRSGTSDLYYTVFGLEGLLALESNLNEASPELVEALQRTRVYLETVGAATELDFVHLCSLARASAAVASVSEARASGFSDSNLVAALNRYRSPDGGFNPVQGAATGTAYAAFLGLGAFQDLKSALPEPERLIGSLDRLRTSDGAWTNELLPAAARPCGATNATAAVLTVLRNLAPRPEPAAAQWLLDRTHPQGGFRATPDAPIPDLLSTATALHALAGLEVGLEPAQQERCLDFVDSLWTNAGAFHGHWGDDHTDCEYTYYGLLALGHLSL